MPALSMHGQPNAATDWFGSPPGRAILDSEQACIARALAERPQPWLWLAPQLTVINTDGRGIALTIRGEGWWGPVHCALPLPLASESFGIVVLQHVVAGNTKGAALLDECTRILVPGGRLYLFALNPLTPYRLRWRGTGLRAHEPVTWRRRLRAAGLTPELVSQGLGPHWSIAAADRLQDGPGLCAAYLLRAEKRTVPLTPMRARQSFKLSEGLPAA